MATLGGKDSKDLEAGDSNLDDLDPTQSLEGKLATFHLPVGGCSTMKMIGDG